MTSRIAKPPLQHERKKRKRDDPKHLANIRLLDCLVCRPGDGIPGSFKVQAHHLMRVHGEGQRGHSYKSADRWTIPLCWAHHGPSPYDNVTDAANDDEWLAERGIDGRAIASALWAARGDLEAMRRVIFRARQEASMKLKANA